MKRAYQQRLSEYWRGTAIAHGPRPAATLTPLPSNRRAASAACMPERENLELSGHLYQAVVEIIANPCEVQATHAGQHHISSASSDLRVDPNEGRNPIEILSNRIRRLGSVDAPPVLSRANLSGGEEADDNLERLAHSRLRRSERSCLIGMVSPRSH